MKKLICLEDVTKAHEAGVPLCVNQNTIITPAAQDLIEELHVPLNESCEPQSKELNLPDELNQETLLQLLKMILAGETNPFQCEKHASGLKVVKATLWK